MTDYTKKYIKYKSRYLNNKDKEMDKYESGNVLDYFYNDKSSKNYNGHAMILVKSDTCQYCISFKEAWNTISNNRLNTCKFISYDINRDSKKIDKLGYDIVGVPELVMVALKNGEPVPASHEVYNGDRTSLSIDAFLENFFKKKVIDDSND